MRQSEATPDSFRWTDMYDVQHIDYITVFKGNLISRNSAIDKNVVSSIWQLIICLHPVLIAMLIK
jgi:hypothetical protein